MPTCKICSKDFETVRITSHIKFCEKKSKLKQVIEELYDKGISIKSFAKSLGVSKNFVYKALKGKIRSLSESISLVHKLHPENLKHTQKTKDKIRNKLLKAHKEGRAFTWPKTKSTSYAEKYFTDFLKRHSFVEDIDFKREVKIGRYRVDFLFLKSNLIIEVDGEQHVRFEDRVKKDIKRDKFLKDLGFDIVRVSWRVICNQKREILDRIIVLIKDKNVDEFNIHHKIVFDEIEKRKTEELNKKKELLEQKRQQDKIQSQQLQVAISCEGKHRGWKSAVAKRLGISHTSVGRRIRKFNLSSVV